MQKDDEQLNELIRKYEGAWQSGYAAFPSILHERGLRRGVEVGVAFGGHSGAILERGGVDKLFGIDRYRHRGDYDDPMNLSQNLFDRLAQRVVERMAPFGERFELIREDSSDAGEHFTDGSLDFVYLDADHSERGVWRDLCTWAIKVRPHGIIAGHDYGHEDFPGVKRAVDRFFQRFGWRVHEAGHGVWWVEREHLPISFFSPCYNCADWVKETATAIINGNLQPGDEYILVNDGSTDDTAIQLAEIAAMHPAVRVITHDRNGGGSAARNTAVAAAKNPLCFCVDSDNIIPPNAIIPLRDHLIRTGTDTVGFQTLKYFTDAGGTEQVTHELSYDAVITDFARSLRTTKVPGASGNYLFTKEAWQRAGGYPEGAGALDAWGFGLRKCATGSTMTVLPGSFYYHRHDHNSYWARHAKQGTIDRSALEVLRPFFDQIDPADVRYLKSSRGRERWFTELDRRPMRLKQEKPKGRAATNEPVIKAGLTGLFKKLVQRAA